MTGRTPARQVATSAPNAHALRPAAALRGAPVAVPVAHEGRRANTPAEQGAPTQLNYAVMEKERARHALMQMHEHLSRQFPEVCPMTLTDPGRLRGVQPDRRTARVAGRPRASARAVTPETRRPSRRPCSRRCGL